MAVFLGGIAMRRRMLPATLTLILAGVAAALLIG